LKAEEESFEYALRGKAWKVYWLLLKTGRPMSVREVQKALHFSSPSVAQHHLEQLRELGLVQKQNIGSHYLLINEVKIGGAPPLCKAWKDYVSKVFLLRLVLNNLLHNLPFNAHARLHARKLIHHLVWRDCFGNILV